jgi:hypothetical protein
VNHDSVSIAKKIADRVSVLALNITTAHYGGLAPSFRFRNADGPGHPGEIGAGSGRAAANGGEFRPVVRARSGSALLIPAPASARNGFSPASTTWGFDGETFIAHSHLHAHNRLLLLVLPDPDNRHLVAGAGFEPATFRL